jgi:S-DNA-T family DNA segregation ATPase FtsK/SpoIIIE
MIKKILKVELVSLFLIATLNLIYFSYKESLPDNYYVISDKTFFLENLLYYPASLLAHVGFYSGIWTFLSFVLIGFSYLLLTKKRNHEHGYYFLVLPLSFSLIVCFLFFPVALGDGALVYLNQLASQSTYFLLFLTHLLGIYYLIWPQSFLKVSKLILKKVKTYVMKVSKFEMKNTSMISIKSQLMSQYNFIKSKFNSPKPIIATQPTLRVSNQEEKVELKVKVAPPVEELVKDDEIEDEVEIEEEIDNDEYIEDSIDDELLEEDDEIIPQKSSSFFESDELIACIVPEKNNTTRPGHIEDQYFKQIASAIEDKLKEFNISAQVINVLKGPVVDTFEITLGAGVKVSGITNRTDDLSLALWGVPIRMVYPMKGKTTIGIEVPRTPREVIYLDDVLKSESYLSSSYRLPVAMGKDAYGESCVMDLTTMPHMLVAGSTGAGKSVFINTLLVSLIIKLSPEKLKLILIDPKQLELALYQKLPHLILPVVTTPQTASIALLWAVEEMERRYSMLKELGVKNIEGYNKKLHQADIHVLAKIKKYIKDDAVSEKSELPYLVIIVDEFADLVLSKEGKEIETNISRLAAKARASGIHIILATQRPSTDVITGVIKANFPTRVSFRVTSSIDSRVVLDVLGADKLLGKGDMLFKLGVDLMRLHSAYVDEQEIEHLVQKLSNIPAQFSEEALEFIETNIKSSHNTEGMSESNEHSIEDGLFNEATVVVREMGVASASMLQRRLRIGYNRAANLIEEMERKGIVGPQQGSKPRVVFPSQS